MARQPRQSGTGTRFPVKKHLMWVLNCCQGASVDPAGSRSGSDDPSEASHPAGSRTSLSNPVGTGSSRLSARTSLPQGLVELPATPIGAGRPSTLRSTGSGGPNASRTSSQQPGLTPQPVTGGSRPGTPKSGMYTSPSDSNVSFRTARSRYAPTPPRQPVPASHLAGAPRLDMPMTGWSRSRSSSLRSKRSDKATRASFHSASELPADRLWGLDRMDQPPGLYNYHR